MDKNKVKQELEKWSKRAAFFAVFGVTGTAALLVYNWYQTTKKIDEIDWENNEN